MSIADASAAELETQMIISKDLYPKIDFLRMESLLPEVQKMLFTMIKKLNAKRYPLKPQGGYIALISILIIGALVLMISVGVSLRSIGETNMSLGEEKAHRALALANLCVERGLMKIMSVLNYAGNESIVIDGESCDILPVEGNGNARTLKTKSTVSGYTRKLKVSISQISPIMIISSWEEVGDF